MGCAPICVIPRVSLLESAVRPTATPFGRPIEPETVDEPLMYRRNIRLAMHGQRMDARWHK